MDNFIVAVRSVVLVISAQPNPLISGGIGHPLCATHGRVLYRPSTVSEYRQTDDCDFASSVANVSRSVLCLSLGCDNPTSHSLISSKISLQLGENDTIKQLALIWHTKHKKNLSLEIIIK